jgi:uncharacterized metal-binding protein
MPDLCEELELLYSETEIRKFAQAATRQERAGYYFSESGRRPKKTRVEEILELANKMGFKKIGIAFCFGLKKEAKILADLTRHRGFEVVSMCCKVWGIPKEYLGLSSGEKLEPASFEAMCNPIGQAKVLNREGTDLNVLLGLCVGHDSLFFKYADAWTIVLATKDRLLGHNALAALYTIESYYKVLGSPSEHHKTKG